MKTSGQIRVLTVDDCPLFLEGLGTIIRSQPDMLLIGQACSCRQALAQFGEGRPDVTLVDLRLTDMSGIDAMIAIQKQFLGARVIIVSGFEGHAPVQRALEAGARSYIRKNMPPQEIVDVVRRVHAGKKFVPAAIAEQIAEHLGDERLTEREIDVLLHIAGGNRNRDIGEKLFIAEETVKAHIKHIMSKLGACDRTHALAIALRHGLIQL